MARSRKHLAKQSLVDFIRPNEKKANILTMKLGDFVAVLDDMRRFADPLNLTNEVTGRTREGSTSRDSTAREVLEPANTYREGFGCWCVTESGDQWRAVSSNRALAPCS